MLTSSDIQFGREFHYGSCTREVGPRGGTKVHTVIARRNGETKYWKTRPNDFRIPIKVGWKEYGYIDQDNAHLFHMMGECPLLQTEGEVK